MIGLDTNVLIRGFLPDEDEHGQIARSFMRDHCSAADPGFVNRVVLCEAVWVLERRYRYTRAQIVDFIDHLLRVSVLAVESPHLVVEAVELARVHAAGFADILIGLVNREAGCAATATFDRRAARLPQFLAAPMAGSGA